MERKSPQYLKWVRTLECNHYGAPPPSEAHHIRGIGNFGGMGLRAPDVLVVPLCRTCHRAMHNFPELWPDQPLMVLQTLLEAFENGVIEVTNDR